MPNALLQRALAWSRGGGCAEAAVKQHVARKKLLVRDRVARLCDAGAPFLELSPLASYGDAALEAPSAGIVTGVGVVGGKRVMVMANDATVKGGTLMPITVKKQLRAMELAYQRRIPCVYLVDSGGAFLPLQTEIFPSKEHGGRTFYWQARMSSAGIPQLAAIMGSCTAGAAYVPAMSDETVIVDKTGTVFLGGPPLVKAATGETVTAEQLGGARVHCEKSGLTDHFVTSDEEAIAVLREIIGAFHDSPGSGLISSLKRPNPAADAARMSRAVSLAPRDRVDAFLDEGSKVHEFKERYGTSVVAAVGKLGGLSVGVLAPNQASPPGSESPRPAACMQGLLKAAHFVQLCERRRYPLVVLLEGDHALPPSPEKGDETDAQAAALLRAGAKLGAAMAGCTVPRVTVVTGPTRGITGAMFGARSMDPTFVFSWPGGLMATDEATAAEFPGQPVSDEHVPALKASARIVDDGVIEPGDTRAHVFDALCAAIEHAPLALSPADSASRHAPVSSLDVHYAIPNGVAGEGLSRGAVGGFGVFRM